MSLLLREHALAMIGPAAFLATVVSVKDPESHNRVQVRIYDVDGVTNQDATLWARVAVPFAGDSARRVLHSGRRRRGGRRVFIGRPALPIVIGGLWNGQDRRRRHWRFRVIASTAGRLQARKARDRDRRGQFRADDQLHDTRRPYRHDDGFARLHRVHELRSDRRHDRYAPA